MNEAGRHIMINCDGEGNEPPVSIEGLCVFIATQLTKTFVLSAGMPDPVISGKVVAHAIRMYEKGMR